MDSARALLKQMEVTAEVGTEFTKPSETETSPEKKTLAGLESDLLLLTGIPCLVQTTWALRVWTTGGV